MGTFSVLIVTPNVLQFLRLGSKCGLSIKISPIHPGLYAHAHSEYTDYALVLRLKKNVLEMFLSFREKRPCDFSPHCNRISYNSIDVLNISPFVFHRRKSLTKVRVSRYYQIFLCELFLQCIILRGG